MGYKKDKRIIMIYKNISREDYFAMHGVNASTLKPYYESSLNGNHESEKKRVETPAMRFGTACHSRILEPDTFDWIYDKLKLPINEKTGKEYGIDTKKSQEYIATLPAGKKHLSFEEFETLEKIEKNLKQNTSAIKILTSCPDREMAITWTDNESGIECKALLDFVGHKIAGDFKTTKEIKFRNDPVDVAKVLQWELIGNKNMLQFAFYRDGLIANNINIERFAVIFAQNNGNCETLTAFLSDYSLEYGRNMYTRALLNYANKDDNQSAFNALIEI